MLDAQQKAAKASNTRASVVSSRQDWLNTSPANTKQFLSHWCGRMSRASASSAGGEKKTIV
jgi:hypothetical protein